MGSKDSGFIASCQSYDGSIVSSMEMMNGEVQVYVTAESGSTGYHGFGSRKLLFMPMKELLSKLDAGYELRLVKPRKRRTQ